jgi:flagellar motor component MotA
MSFEQIDALFTDMAHLARREGIEALQPLIAAAGDRLLRHGLEMVCDQVAREQIVQELEERMREALRQAQTRHRMVAVGIGAVQSGKTPAEVEQAVRRAAAQPTV